jgi:hypothetical protein
VMRIAAGREERGDDHHIKTCFFFAFEASSIAGLGYLADVCDVSNWDMGRSRFSDC